MRKVYWGVQKEFIWTITFERSWYF